MPNCHEDLTRLLHSVQLHHTAGEVDALALRAAKEGLTHAAFLYAFVQQEATYREQRRFERLLRESRLPREKTLAQLDLSRFGPVLAQQIERLQHGTFVQQAVNVIAVGKPGTGKSHVAAAVGHLLIQHGHPVYWTSTATLVQQLLVAKRDLRLPRELARLDRFACVILDDIGYCKLQRRTRHISSLESGIPASRFGGVRPVGYHHEPTDATAQKGDGQDAQLHGSLDHPLPPPEGLEQDRDRRLYGPPPRYHRACLA